MTQLLTLLLTLMSIPSAYRMMVASDLHMLDSAQYTVSSASFQNEQSYDRKNPELADAAFTALMDSALRLRPDVVLIPGDLTYMGAKTDHLAAAAQLHRLTDAGIHVCLIPGNHDIISQSYAYWGSTKTVVPSVTDAEFDSIYAFCNTPFTNRRQDPNGSHSYVQTIAPRLTLLGIDASHHEVDGIGSLTGATLLWLLAQADSAVAAGDRVMAMLHFQMLEPIDRAAAVYEKAFVANNDVLKKMLCAHGVDLLLTGHVHINDVTTDFNSAGDSLVEISTGSVSAYPLPFRMITATDTFSHFVCETHFVRTLNGYGDVQARARTTTTNYIKNVLLPHVIEWAWAKRDTLPKMIDDIENYPSALSVLVSKNDLKKHVNKILNSVPQTAAGRAALANQYMGDDVVKALFVHMDGNEGNQDTDDLQDDIWDDVQDLGDYLIEKTYTGLINVTRGTLKSALAIALPIVKDLDVVKNLTTSYFEDITHVGESAQNRTDDLTPRLNFQHLVYMPTAYTQFSVSECDSYVWNDQEYTVSGDYTDTLSTVHGCDSIVTLHLTINKSVATEFSATECDAYVWNEKEYTVSGDYMDTLSTIHGCDSIVTLHLTINKSVATEFSATECDSYVWNEKEYTASGDYTDTLATIHGCDSIVTLHLTINKSVATEFSATECDVYVWNEKEYTVSGDYTDTLSTIHGCDSIVTLHLTINKSVTTEFSATECDVYVWNEKEYTVSGDYTDTLATIHGCDSIVTLHLTINKSVATEFSDSAYVEYTWNEQTYTQSGDYEQTLQTIQGCDSVVTLHLTIMESPITGKEQISVSDIRVYPNPASHILYIQGEGIQAIDVYAASGQLMEQLPAVDMLDVQQWSNGVYILRIKQNDQYVYREVLKQ